MITTDILKAVLILIVAFMLLGFVFNILFKIGILALMVLGVLYLFRKVFID